MKRTAQDDNDHRSAQHQRRRRHGRGALAVHERPHHEALSSQEVSTRTVEGNTSHGATAEQPSPDLSFPNPRTFPERLMDVLERNAAPDTIWWTDDGAVALHLEKLKTGPVLERYFQRIRYKFFIRNFSRWGFRRNTDITMPCGIFHYHNSLFQKENPFLVKHMRMNSDVQDVFAQHHSNNEVSASSEENNHQVNASTPAETTDPTSGSEEARTAQENQQRQEPESLPLPQLLNLINEGLMSRPSDSPTNNMGLGNISTQSRVPNNSEEPIPSRKGMLLEHILRLANEFLAQSATNPFTPSTTLETALRTMLQAIQIVGRRVLDHHTSTPAGPPSASAAVAVQQLLGGGLQQPQQQTSIPRGARNAQEQALFLCILHLSGVQRIPGLDNDSATRLQEYLLSIAQPQQQQQPVHPPAPTSGATNPQQGQVFTSVQLQELLGHLQRR